MGEQHFLGKLMGDGENYKVVGIIIRSCQGRGYPVLFVQYLLNKH